ncbi:uncharacterized protein LOC119465350 isoform X1 [Dermacentor silvarum]|uniref:uncharacterized protein LOC119465350 isoform X1 n=1 Tax=Dermacentor silvarum TaxID=543639 RepID=UPI001899D19E|nr:uncharacterized protein LOC119465350 isoform X1 [Dermacentor silvarum]
MSIPDTADSERQLAANELRRMGLRVPCLKATPSTGKQATSNGWPLFGLDILEQPQQSSHLVAGLTVPWFLDESLRVLLSHASTEGILRKSGSLARQRLLRSSLETSASLRIASVVLASAPVHDVSGLLKQWLQLLPEPLLPKPLVHLLLRCQVKHGLEAVLLGLRLLPEERLACLRHLLAGLSQLAADPQSRMGPHNLAVVLAPTLCGPPTVQSANREDLDRLVSLVEALIEASHLVGSSPPPLPGREGRKKTSSACLLLHQLRRLVVQRKGPGGEMDAVVPDSAAPNLPPGSKRRKPRELLPRGLSPWKRAKREEGLVPSRQQQAATPELLNKLRLEVALLPPLQVEDEASAKLEDTKLPTSANPAEKAVAGQEEESPSNTTTQPEPTTTVPAVPQTVHFLRGTSTTSSTKSNLRRGRPNSLRSGLPLRHGPGTRRHSSTGSRPKPPVGKENLESSLRFASQENCVFNAPAMAHLAAVKARREVFISQLVSTGPTGPEHGAQLHRESSVKVPHCHLEPVVEAPLTPAKEGPMQDRETLPAEKQKEDEVEAMDVDDSPDTDWANNAREASPSCPEVKSAPAVAVSDLPPSPALHERHEQTTLSGPLCKRDEQILPSAPANASAAFNDGFCFALPAVPPEQSPANKRESIIQIRERNAGMVRSSVEVFNRAAAAVHESTVVTRSRRTAVARKGSVTAASRPPLRETNFRRPASPQPAATRRERRDWQMEL